jgi:hypothetical protein
VTPAKFIWLYQPPNNCAAEEIVMKTWMLVLSLVAVLGFTGLADAKGVKKDKGIKGTIVSVTGKSFTMTLHAGKKNANANPTTITVDTTNATVTGDLAAGAKVTVVGSQSGDKITATTVKVGKAHKKKNA